MRDKEHLKIIFFDGLCTLCHFWVRVTLKYDKKRTFKMSSLQGLKAQMYLSDHDRDNLKAVILFTENKQYEASDALIEISKELSFPLSLAKYMIFIPKVIRDFFYYKVAKNRYRLFKRADSCSLVQESQRERFLD